MTTRQELENLLQGRDAVANAVIDHLLANGWEGDRILKNLATKTIPPALSGNPCHVRLGIPAILGERGIREQR